MSATPKSDHRNEPTYWFAVLEIARERGDFEKAAEAKRELLRLGVRVSYGKPSSPQPVAVAGGTT